MSLRTPPPNPPYPYYPSGVVVNRTQHRQKGLKRGKRVRAKRQSFARERRQEQVFKFGQIRSGLDGLTTYRGRPNNRPSREQVASDFLALHKSSLANKMRDDAETDRALKKKTLELEDIKQTKEEQFRTRQLALQEQQIRDAQQFRGRELYDRARFQKQLLETATEFFIRGDERERRQGEMFERIATAPYFQRPIPLGNRGSREITQLATSPVLSPSVSRISELTPTPRSSTPPRSRPSPTAEERAQRREGAFPLPRVGSGGAVFQQPPLQEQVREQEQTAVKSRQVSGGGQPLSLGRLSLEPSEGQPPERPSEGIPDPSPRPVVGASSPPRERQTPRGTTPPKRGRATTDRQSPVPTGGNPLTGRSPPSAEAPSRRQEAEIRTQARLETFAQTLGASQGNTKKTFLPSATQFPALEILADDFDERWTGRKSKQVPSAKGVYRFKALGSEQGKGNTKLFNLYRSADGKVGDGQEFQLNFHKNRGHFEDLVRQGKIRIKDVDDQPQTSKAEFQKARQGLKASISQPPPTQPQPEPEQPQLGRPPQRPAPQRPDPNALANIVR